MLMTSHSLSPNPSPSPELVGLVGLKLELRQRIFINIGINK